MLPIKLFPKARSNVNTTEKSVAGGLYFGSYLSPKTHELIARYEAKQPPKNGLKLDKLQEQIWWQKTGKYPR